MIDETSNLCYGSTDYPGTEKKLSTPDFQMVRKPYPHQQVTFDETREQEGYAIFWEQGTGKSKHAIDVAAWLRLTEKINGLIIIATNGVHFNWIKDELPGHMPPNVEWIGHAWSSQKSKTKAHAMQWRAVLEKPRTLAVLAISYDAACTKAGEEAIQSMLRRRKCMIVIDESKRIATPKAERSRIVLGLRYRAKYRRVMTGTPVSGKPFDVYNQIKFVDDKFWERELNLSTYTAFKNYFGVFETELKPGAWKLEDPKPGKDTYQRLVSYRRLDVLEQTLKKISSRVTKDVLGLPPKVYAPRYFDMSPKQHRIYNDLKTQALALLDGDQSLGRDLAKSMALNIDEYEELMSEHNLFNREEEKILRSVTAPLAIVQLLRMQQVTCGYVKSDDGELVDLCGEDNPRMNLLFEELETALEEGTKVIVWSRFRPDIDTIVKRLHNRTKAVRYDGTCNDDQKEYARNAFQYGDAQVFVANQAAAGEGLTLTSSRKTIYYANSFKLTERQQSEDRNHRIGQEGTVVYTDLICRDSVDEKIVDALRRGIYIASLVLGDKLREWI